MRILLVGKVVREYNFSQRIHSSLSSLVEISQYCSSLETLAIKNDKKAFKFLQFFNSLLPSIYYVNDRQTYLIVHIVKFTSK